MLTEVPENSQCLDGKTEASKQKGTAKGPPLDTGWALPTGLVPVAPAHPSTWSAP